MSAYQDVEAPSEQKSYRMKKVHRNSTTIGHTAYQVLPLTTIYEINGPDEIDYVQTKSGGEKFYMILAIIFLPVISWLYFLGKTFNVQKGKIALIINNGRPEFLAPGWHCLASIFRTCQSIKMINDAEPIVVLTKGIVTIPDGHVGIAQDKGQYVILGPGMHQWDSETFNYIKTVEIQSSNVIKFGPYTLVTAPAGDVVVTENNGTLMILNENPETKQRTHFLDHSKWIYKGMLSIQVQIDELKSSNLLTADRVEVNLESTVSWKIVDPHLAALSGGHTMDQIREIVHRAGRATLSDMISSRNISDKSVGQMAHHNIDDTECSTQKASVEQLRLCNENLKRIGVELGQIAIVRLTIAHEDMRREIAKIAAIPAKTKELREIAQAQAQNEVTAAEGRAKAQIALAQAEATSIAMIAEAQKRAGELLGAPNTTASTLAQIEMTGKALNNAKSTVFFIPPGQTQQLLANPNFLAAPK